MHGGPGVPSDYIEDITKLATDTRCVILYDQLGCGRSDRPDNPTIWTIQRFVDELITVRKELGLDKIHLWGQSWGGILYLLPNMTALENVMAPLLPHQRKLEFDLKERAQDLLERTGRGDRTHTPAYQVVNSNEWQLHVH